MLHPHEHGALARYVERGGAILVMLDPRSRTDLYEDLRNWGIGFGDDVIVDSQHALFVLPQAIALVGVFVWWGRRRAGGR